MQPKQKQKQKHSGALIFGPVTIALAFILSKIMDKGLMLQLGFMVV